MSAGLNGGHLEGGVTTSALDLEAATCARIGGAKGHVGHPEEVALKQPHMLKGKGAYVHRKGKGHVCEGAYGGKGHGSGSGSG